MRTSGVRQPRSQGRATGRSGRVSGERPDLESPPGRAVVAALAFAAVSLLALPVLARPRKPRVTYEDGRKSRPSAVYASMDRAACLKELGARKIAHVPVASARGVLAPVRLDGPIGGVRIRTEAPAIERAASPA